MAEENTEVVEAPVQGDPAAGGNTVTEPKPAAEPAKTLLEDPGDKQAVAPADWPEDWREKLAGKDDKLLSRMKRFKSIENVVSSWRDAEKRITSGELKSALPENATEEQISAWRKDNGIPEKPEEYDLGGVDISDDDKPAVGEFLKMMHAEHATPAQLKSSIAAFFKLKADAAASVAEQDAKTKKDSEDELRAEFGADYRRYMMGAHSLLDAMPEGMKANLMGARLADGTLFANNASAMRWLVQTSMELNPMATVVPGSGESAVKSLNDEIAGIEKTLREAPQEYWRDQNMQSRLQELYRAREKVSQRAA